MFYGNAIAGESVLQYAVSQHPGVAAKGKAGTIGIMQLLKLLSTERKGIRYVLESLTADRQTRNSLHTLK